MTSQPSGLSPRSVVSEAVRARLGERFGASRVADSGHLELFVVEPTAVDRAFVEAVAREAGIEGSVRVLTFEPEWAVAWRELSPQLEQLRTRGVLSSGGSLGLQLQLPPWRVSLNAYAVSDAIALHGQYGSLLSLRVGFLAYPPDGVVPVPRLERERTMPADPQLISAELDRPAVVASGRTARHELLVTNRSDTTVTVCTGDTLRTEIADPQSGVAVGGVSGGRRALGRHYEIGPRLTRAVPLLIGTASFAPELGYAVPAGDWSLRIVLRLRDGDRQTVRPTRRVLLPPLPVTITD